MSKPRFNDGLMIYLDQDRAYELWSQGLCDRDIAEALGMKKNAVSEWRRRNQLQVNKQPKKPKLEKKVSRLSQDVREARKAGMNYGMWKAKQFEKQVKGRAQIDRLRGNV